MVEYTAEQQHPIPLPRLPPRAEGPRQVLQRHVGLLHLRTRMVGACTQHAGLRQVRSGRLGHGLPPRGPQTLVRKQCSNRHQTQTVAGVIYFDCVWFAARTSGPRGVWGWGASCVCGGANETDLMARHRVNVEKVENLLVGHRGVSPDRPTSAWGPSAPPEPTAAAGQEREGVAPTPA